MDQTYWLDLASSAHSDHLRLAELRSPIATLPRSRSSLFSGRHLSSFRRLQLPIWPHLKCLQPLVATKMQAQNRLGAKSLGHSNVG